jgi:hypothetical protein
VALNLFPYQDILIKEEINHEQVFVVNLSSKEESRELFRNMLNDCYKYAATATTINAKVWQFPD